MYIGVDFIFSFGIISKIGSINNLIWFGPTSFGVSWNVEIPLIIKKIFIYIYNNSVKYEYIYIRN